MGIPETIIKQMGGPGKLKMMVGAHDFLKDGENVVMFKFKSSKKANFMKITLNSMDTYDIEFSKVKNMTSAKATKWLGLSQEEINKKMEPTNKVSFAGIYCDQLQGVFEDHTGLYLSL